MIKRKLVLIFCFSVIVLGTVFGAQYDYWVKDYNLNLVVGKDAVNSVSEDYTFYYATAHHGFFRDIPIDYSQEQGPSRKAKISSLSCSDSFSKEKENGYLTLKIGDEDKEYIGNKDYNISYLYDIGADTNEGFDEFYFNIVGPYWECPFETVSFSVTIPCSLADTQNYIFVTRGRYSSDSQINFDVTETQDGIVVSGKTQNLMPGEAVTLRVQLPEAWYENAREPYDYRNTWSVLSPVLSGLALLICLTIWAMFGRDSVPIITAKFKAPEDFSPLVEGFLSDGTVDDKDITSMLYYWADKGYLTISEEKRNKFVFTKIGDIDLSSPEFERSLFYGFFSKGNVVTIDSLRESNFFEVMAKCKESVALYFTKSRKLKDSKSLGMSVICFVLAIAIFVFASFSSSLFEGGEEGIIIFAVIGLVYCFVQLVSFKALFSRWYVRKSNTFAVIRSLLPAFLLLSFTSFFLSENLFIFLTASLSCIICVFLASITEKRSEYGTKLLEGTLGYREFIEKVQISELITMIDKDPMLYYHVLSYAIVFGLEKKWSKKFESVAVPPPVWYTGSNAFNYMMFANMSSRMNTSIKNSVAHAQQSMAKPGKLLGGSSFGTSGFAGGGFGGGGGHAW